MGEMGVHWVNMWGKLCGREVGGGRGCLGNRALLRVIDIGKGRGGVQDIFHDLMLACVGKGRGVGGRGVWKVSREGRK